MIVVNNHGPVGEQINVGTCTGRTGTCPECSKPVETGTCGNGVMSVDGLARHYACHRARMASLKDGPGSGTGGSPFANGSAGYVAR
jgi:hypothetical protein